MVAEDLKNEQVQSENEYFEPVKDLFDPLQSQHIHEDFIRLTYPQSALTLYQVPSGRPFSAGTPRIDHPLLLLDTRGIHVRLL